MDGLSDRGSTPLRSTYDAKSELNEFGFCVFSSSIYVIIKSFLCRRKSIMFI